MIDWSSVFDEAYPVAGAPPSDLERLVAEVGRPLPPSYLSLLSWSDGGEFRTGGRWFQFFPALDPGHGVLAMSEAYGLPRFMPQALPLAFNGGGTFYLLDMRGPAAGGEYPVVCSHAGNLGWSAEECVRVAGSFPEACRGTIDVDELRRTA
ncbi:SMI1/KNR4 family protein [Tautonia sp. JC769]|uniref:SMI1/KNR4 family protein n=1 Tax=Tautonia sp. JC769 TaxID=3232135 RepID=UPI00345A1BFB